MTLSTCIKIGGSLYAEPGELRETLRILPPFAGTIVLITGSGALSDWCKQFVRLHGLTLSDSQEAALLARQRALVAALLVGFHPRLTLAGSLAEIREQAAAGCVPVAEPQVLALPTERLRNGSDVAAAELCRVLGLHSLVKLTDTDGIRPPGQGEMPCARLSARQLAQYGRTCLDAGVADVVRDSRIECVVLNGKHPERLATFLATGEVTIGTRVDVDD